ncbi:MAG: 16S rRNA (cytidine(1402)-2'-O)-methyltransferase [Desulfobacterales bacterium]|jgi:16S rRNA (cytidine1402-2'-O)-methyltransferase
MPKANHTPKKGILYVVATPIGNRDDITLRALDILRQVDLIAAEDTRKSGRFLAHHHIKNQMVSYHEHNETKRTPQLIEKLLAGTSLALISNAGTPSVSDPGFRLIAAAIDHKIVVTPIPGVTAATAAMSVSGLPTDSFTFVGFAPKKKGKRIRFLKALGTRSESLLFYESPKRIISLMQDIIVCMGDRYAILAREMTKLHEEFIRGTVSQILNVIRSRSTVKGECTLLVAGRHQLDEMDIRSVRATLESALENETGSLSEIARHIAQEYGLPKKTVYDLALEIRGRRTEVGGQKSEDRRLRTED